MKSLGAIATVTIIALAALSQIGRGNSPGASADAIGRYQFLNTGFNDTFYRAHGAILKIDTVTGETWRFDTTDNAGNFVWVPIPTRDATKNAK